MVRYLVENTTYLCMQVIKMADCQLHEKYEQCQWGQQ